MCFMVLSQHWLLLPQEWSGWGMKLISHPQLELRNYTFTLLCAFMTWSLIGTGCNLLVLLQCSFGKWLSFILSVHPSVCMKQLGSHQMDFHEILRWEFLLKFVDTLQLSLKSDLGYECTKSVSFCTHFLTCYCCYWACPYNGEDVPSNETLGIKIYTVCNGNVHIDVLDINP